MPATTSWKAGKPGTGGCPVAAPGEPAAAAPREKAHVVGPVCESRGFFAQERELPPLRQGDLAALMSAGAYGFAMASNYNSRPLPAEVLVKGGKPHLVRERQTSDDLVRGEHLVEAAER